MDSMFFSIVLGLIITVSTAILFYKWGWKGIFFSLPIFVLFLFFSAGTKDLPGFLIPFIAGGAGGYTFREGKTFQFFILFSTISLTLFTSFNYYYMKVYSGFDLISESRSEMLKYLDQYKNEKLKPLAEKNGNGDSTREIIAEFDRWTEFVKDDQWVGVAEDTMPFTLFIYALFFSASGYYIFKLWFSRFAPGSLSSGLEVFRLNDYFIFSVIAGWAIFLLIDKTDYYTVYLISVNIALIVSVLYLIQALGVIKFFLIKKNWPIWIMPLVILFIIFFGGAGALVFISLMLTGFGTLDLWADFRKLNSEININN